MSPLRFGMVISLCLWFVLAGTQAQVCTAQAVSAQGVAAQAVSAQETPSHQVLQQGDPVGVFYVTKVAGAESDGVSPGEQLCYRCRYGSRPMVMVFTRKTGRRLTDLVRRLDLAVATNRGARLKGLVTFLGKDTKELQQCATSVAETAIVKEVPVVIAEETETGPANYKLPDDADVTIVVAKDSQVVHTHVYDVNHIDVTTVMNDVERIIR